MNITRRILAVGVTALSMTAAPATRAQYTADFQTNIISGVTSNWTGDYRVGNANSADALVIQSNGVLTDGSASLGYSSNSSNNSALVTDSGSIWSNGFLYVGYNGFGNSLVISNGAQVLNAGEAWVSGGGIPRIGSNSVVVTGNSTVWSNGQDLSVGDPGACNRVVVRNGGLLINYNGRVGSYYSGSSNNSLVVSDTGSVWTNTGDLYIGYWGSSNSLTVGNGGNVFSGYGYVGYEIGASNNSVLVSGVGSLWTNRNDLSIGYSGAGNSLAVLSSGAVYNSIGYIGNSGTIGNNAVVVSGTGSVWSIVNGVYVGNGSAGNSLVISNGGRVVTGYTDSYLGYNASSSNNSVLVSDPVSLWSNRNFFLCIGYDGAGNSLVISNGGVVLSNGGTVGNDSSSKNNRVVVTGTGSVWSNRSGTLFVGRNGAGNSLVISNGGQVFDGTSFVGSGSLSSSNNSVLVSGPYSAWRNSSGLVVGGSGWSNSLVVNNGGLVVDSTGTIGPGGSSKNGVLVTGPGSVWSNTSLFVGYSGNGNSLVVSNGAQVINGDAYVGYNFWISPLPLSNEVRVADGGLWQSGAAYIGYGGSSNCLVVAGGSVLATSFVVGFNSSTCDNWAELDSGGVVVTNATHDAVLEVRNGSFIQNGGVLQVDTLVITNPCGVFVRNGGTLLYNSLVLDPNLSAVGDGIPNGWKQQYGLDPLDPNVANEDPDGDGLSNLQEFLGGGNPVADIQAITQEGNDIRVTWGAAPGKTNALQATTGDVDGSYSTNNFADIFIVTNSVDTITNYLDVGAATNSPSRFYRVRLVP